MNEDRDEDRVSIPLDPETALRALLKVDPNSEPVDKPDKKPDKSQRAPDT
jgi:hypothetical protein